MTGFTTPAPRFSIGNVVSLTFSIYFRNFWPFFLMAFVVNLPSLLMQIDTVSSTAEEVGGFFSVTGALGGLLNLLLSYVVTGAILFGVYQQMRGEPFSMARALNIAGSRVLSILMVSLISGVVVGVGFILLVIPGVILYLMLMVAVPATVVERIGPLDALGRSMSLTRGHRLELLGLIIIFALLMLLITSAANFTVGMNLRTDSSMGWIVAWHAFTVAVSLIQSVFLGVVYYELRRSKEGLDLHQLAASFE